MLDVLGRNTSHLFLRKIDLLHKRPSPLLPSDAAEVAAHMALMCRQGFSFLKASSGGTGCFAGPFFAGCFAGIFIAKSQLVRAFLTCPGTPVRARYLFNVMPPISG